MANPIRLGMLTPSINTCLEPVSVEIVRHVPEVSLHFTRFRAPNASLGMSISDGSLLTGAHLLADAQVHSIAYNATSGSWLGPSKDRQLIASIQDETATPATTATLAMLASFRFLGLDHVSILFPGLDEVTHRIGEVYQVEGLTCVRRVHMGIIDNRDIDYISSDRIAQAVVDSAAPGAQAIAVIGTNFRAAPLVSELERRLGIPIIDSVAATLWHSLQLAGYEEPIPNWGILLAQVRPRGGVHH